MFCQVRALDRKSEIYPPGPYGEKRAIPSVKSRHCPLRSTRWYFSLGSRGELTDHDQFSGHRRCRGSRFLREHSMIRRWRAGGRLDVWTRRPAPFLFPDKATGGAGSGSARCGESRGRMAPTCTDRPYRTAWRCTGLDSAGTLVCFLFFF